jgi:hypothetical protein
MKKKVSLLKMDETCFHEDGAPLQVRAKAVAKEDMAKLLEVHEAMAKRTKASLERAVQEWPETPAAGLTPDSVVPPVVPTSSSVPGEGKLDITPQ